MYQPPNSTNRTGGNDAPMPAFSRYRGLVASGAFEPTKTTADDRPYTYTLKPAANAPAATVSNAYASMPLVGTPPPGYSTVYAPAGAAPYPPRPTFHDVHMLRPAYSAVPGHMQGQPPYMGASAPQYWPLLAPPGPTQQMISARVQEMLHLKLPSWATRAIVLLSVHLSHTIIARGQAGLLGPHGLSTLEDMYMVIGFEGSKRYMALAVNASSRLDILIKGAAVEAEARDPLVDDRFMEELRVGFYHVATSEWQRLDWLIRQSAGS